MHESTSLVCMAYCEHFGHSILINVSISYERMNWLLNMVIWSDEIINDCVWLANRYQVGSMVCLSLIYSVLSP